MVRSGSLFDWRLVFTREALGGAVAVLSTAVLVALCYGGMKISGVWSGL